MNAEIIAVGSELLTPQRVDTDSLYLTRELNARGIEVVRKAVVGDDRERLAAEIRRSLASAEIVIVTGGLGPTLDDLTREATSDALGRELVFHQHIVDDIEARFRRFNRKMAEINKRQAYVVEGAEILPNSKGTAPGQWIDDPAGILLLLPGPPRELQSMFEEQCRPRLDRIESPYQYYTVSLRVALMPESDLDQRISPIYSAEPRVATTILAAPGDIQVHLRAKASTVEEARGIAEALAGKVEAELSPRVYTRQNESMVEVVARGFREKGLTLAVAESCTGGMLAEKITALPGSSEYFAGGMVSYSEEAKIRWLGVKDETIRRYGAVSRETAEEMAEQVRRKINASIGVSITGVAGPDGGTEQTPVGTVFIGVADEEGVEVKDLHLGGERDRVRLLAAQTALELLRRKVT